MNETITAFTGKYAFLSNFWPGGLETLEHEFQTAKACAPVARWHIKLAPTPKEAKRRGRSTLLRPHWEDIKLEVMLALLRKKFAPGTDLAKWLLATGESRLVEGNSWGDTFWGVCSGVGKNHLGRLLMQVRSELKDV